MRLIMKITLDISMYPLQKDYEDQILEFISKLEGNTDFSLRINALSTQIQGDQQPVMDAVNNAIAEVYEKGIRATFIMKVLPGDIDLNYDHTV